MLITVEVKNTEDVPPSHQVFKEVDAVLVVYPLNTENPINMQALDSERQQYIGTVNSQCVVNELHKWHSCSDTYGTQK